MKPVLKVSPFILLIAILIHISCRKETSCEGCATKNNKPPIAVAGPDQVITLPIDSVLLDGRSSSDPDGNISNYLWTKISGPVSSNIIKPSDSITKVKYLVAGSYFFELKVTDNVGLSAKDTMRIIVDSVLTTNHPPIANAGADQIITLPTNAVNLDGSASTDPENNITSYAWTKISGPSSFNIASVSTVQTQVTNLVQGTYQFELKVTDNGRLSARDTMQVFVNATTNHPPIANAGNDTTIILPANIINLDGSRSTDPENNIVSYIWSKISGPPSFSMANPNTVQTQVTSLAAGIYKFELKVTDAGGLFSKDTVLVTVNDAGAQCNLTMVLVGILSMSRDHLAAAAAGTKVLFAGGWSVAYNDVTSRVDIYDTVSQTWSTAELTQARYDISVIAVGNKIFFAGGTDDWFYTSRIDIYDVSSNTWSTAELSKARGRMAVAAIGNKVFFAGGDCFDGVGGGTMINSVSDVVDIYDISTSTWTVSHLSERRGSLEFAGTSLNNKFYVAGGFFHQWGASPYISNKVDVYDNASGSWSATTLANARADIGTAVADNKIFWVGGHDFSSASDEVEILDINLQTRNFYHLSQARGRIQTAIKDNKIIFFTGDYGDKIDIYNIITQTWCWAQTPLQVNYSGLVVSGNNIYVGGGTIGSSADTNQVWKLEF